ncbi:hypothetical protein BC833DRAFT_181583 [Globomyces pollinis-pini]|nr:hypothetical protein BC833DRAFT_181583 [Globomyces pollinis-pini]
MNSEIHLNTKDDFPHLKQPIEISSEDDDRVVNLLHVETLNTPFDYQKVEIKTSQDNPSVPITFKEPIHIISKDEDKSTYHPLGVELLDQPLPYQITQTNIIDNYSNSSISKDALYVVLDDDDRKLETDSKSNSTLDNSTKDIQPIHIPSDSDTTIPETKGNVDKDLLQKLRKPPKNTVSFTGFQKVIKKRKYTTKNKSNNHNDDDDFTSGTKIHSKNVDRPKRSMKSKVDLKDAFQSDEDVLNDHTLMKCYKYSKSLDVTNSPKQPFQIDLDASVLFIMDLHSHLLKSEIIGFLAGKWNASSNILNVTMAIPCRSVEQQNVDFSDTHFNVEMDPVSELETRNVIADLGLDVIGWYHSHPTFNPDPSRIDLENQRNYQRLFSGNSSPFIGAIISPYNPKSKSARSTSNWFHVPDEGTRPMKLDYQCNSIKCLTTSLCERTVELIRSCRFRDDRIDFNSKWIHDDSKTNLDKLRESLLTYFQSEEAMNLIMNQIVIEVLQWDFDLS